MLPVVGWIKGDSGIAFELHSAMHTLTDIFESMSDFCWHPNRHQNKQGATPERSVDCWSTSWA